MQTTMKIEDWTIRGAQGQPIYGTTHLPQGDTAPAGHLLICHGFKGYKDYGFFPVMADQAARVGLIAHRFNFSHSGVTDQPSTFANPGLFADNTWSKQITDLRLVSHAAATSALPSTTGKHRLPLVWFGHSRGGVTVILTAGQQKSSAGPVADYPAAVIAAAAPCSAYGFSKAQLRDLRRDGHIESPSARTGQTLRVNRIWLDEIEKDPAAHDPIQAISQIRCPILIAHGDADQTVHFDAAHVLHAAAGDRAQLHILPNTTHTFNAPNPLPLDAPVPESTSKLIDLTCRFALQACRTQQ